LAIDDRRTRSTHRSIIGNDGELRADHSPTEHRESSFAKHDLIDSHIEIADSIDTESSKGAVGELEAIASRIPTHLNLSWPVLVVYVCLKRLPWRPLFSIPSYSVPLTPMVCSTVGTDQVSCLADFWESWPKTGGSRADRDIASASLGYVAEKSA
jgi:hypothetical protein